MLSCSIMCLFLYFGLWASWVAQQQRIHLPMQEMWIQSLGGEDPLEKEMATHSSILAWEIPWTEKPGGLQSMESQCNLTTKPLLPPPDFLIALTVQNFKNL